MNLAFLLHTYQPPIQRGSIVKEIAETSYYPLIKLAKNNPSFRFTLNMPLSLSFQLHTNGYTQLLKDIKELYENERIELTSTGAYHTLLTRVPDQIFEKEVLLNEYSLGYYFGKDKGFEGEDAFLIKNVNGFFPPEMAISMDVVAKLDKLGYSWVIADETALPAKDGEHSLAYGFKDMNIRMAVRNKKLSDLLSFTRDSDQDGFIDEVLLLRQEGKDAIVALDGEFFGHHFKEGIFYLETLIEKLNSLGVNFSTVGYTIEKDDTKVIDGIKESTWGSDRLVYPLWDDPENEIHKLQWEIFNKVAAVNLPFAVSDKSIPLDHDVLLETLPVWDEGSLDKVKDIKLKNDLFRQILQLQCLNSDQFWWASKKTIEDRVMYDPKYIASSLELYKKFALVSEDSGLLSFVDEKIQQINAKLV